MNLIDSLDIARGQLLNLYGNDRLGLVKVSHDEMSNHMIIVQFLDTTVQIALGFTSCNVTVAMYFFYCI